MQHFIGFALPCTSAEADIGCGKKLTVIWWPVVSEIFVSKIIKNW